MLPLQLPGSSRHVTSLTFNRRHPRSKLSAESKRTSLLLDTHRHENPDSLLRRARFHIHAASPNITLAKALHSTVDHKEIDMIEGQDIICFCNDWDGDPLSKKHIMQRLAKKNRILWVNSVGVR